MSFKFDPINQTLIEVKEASKWERMIRKRRQYSPFIVVPIMVIILFIGFKINGINYEYSQNKSVKLQGVSR